MNDDVRPVARQSDQAAADGDVRMKGGCGARHLHAAVGDNAEAAGAGRQERVGVVGVGVGESRVELDAAVVARVANARVPEAQRALVALENVCVIRSQRHDVSLDSANICSQFRSSRVVVRPFEYN